MDKTICNVSGCETPSRTKGMCRKHYIRVLHHGDPEVTLSAPRGLNDFERLDWIGWTETESGCWNFNGCLDDHGYGRYKGSSKDSLRAHRVAFERANGPITSRQVVRHTCDNPACVNPGHLESGTQRENLSDAVTRRRIANGERSGTHRLTDQQVAEMRQEYESTDVGTYILARKFGCSRSQVQRIVTYQSRTDLTYVR